MEIKNSNLYKNDVKVINQFIKGNVPSQYNPNLTPYQNVENFRYNIAQELNNNTTNDWPTGTNEFLTALDNVVVQQRTPMGLKFKNYWGRYFKGDILAISAFVEFITTQLPSPRDYNSNTYYIVDGSLALTPIKHFITNQVQKFWSYEISEPILAGAFTTIPNLRGFIQNYTSRIPEAIEVWIQEYADATFPPLVKNIKVINVEAKPLPLRTIFAKVLQDMSKALIPTKEFAGGYASPLSTADKAKVIKLKRVLGDFSLIINPQLYWQLKTEVMTNIINIAGNIFKLEEFKDIIYCSTLSTNEVIVADGEFFQWMFRIRNRQANQTWAANLKYQSFIHLWSVVGSVPWMMARKYSFVASDGPTDFMVISKSESIANIHSFGKKDTKQGIMTTGKTTIEAVNESGKVVKNVGKYKAK